MPIIYDNISDAAIDGNFQLLLPIDQLKEKHMAVTIGCVKMICEQLQSDGYTLSFPIGNRYERPREIVIQW